MAEWYTAQNQPYHLQCTPFRLLRSGSGLLLLPADHTLESKQVLGRLLFDQTVLRERQKYTKIEHFDDGVIKYVL